MNTWSVPYRILLPERGSTVASTGQPCLFAIPSWQGLVNVAVQQVPDPGIDSLGRLLSWYTLSGQPQLEGCVLVVFPWQRAPPVPHSLIWINLFCQRAIWHLWRWWKLSSEIDVGTPERFAKVSHPVFFPILMNNEHVSQPMKEWKNSSTLIFCSPSLPASMWIGNNQ